MSFLSLFYQSLLASSSRSSTRGLFDEGLVQGVGDRGIYYLYADDLAASSFADANAGTQPVALRKKMYVFLTEIP